MTDTTSSAPAAGVAPAESLARARAAATDFLSKLDVAPDAAKELHGIIHSAIDERFAELDDLRIGRVIGSALATL